MRAVKKSRSALAEMEKEFSAWRKQFGEHIEPLALDKWILRLGEARSALVIAVHALRK